jgi:hypothetical protein
MLSQGAEERLAFAQGNGIEGREIAKQSLTVERGEWASGSKVTAKATVPQSPGQIAELSASAREDHGEACYLRQEQDRFSYDVLDVGFGIEGKYLYLVPFALQRGGHVANSQVFFQFCSYYCNFHKWTSPLIF